MLRQIQNFSVCVGNAVEGLVETFVCHAGNGFSIPWYFPEDYDLVFLAVDATYSTYIVLFTYNTLQWMNRKTIFLC